MQSEQTKYSEKLQSPIWQAVRRLIFIRDKFTCQKCKADQDWGYTLEVHHIKYISGREPWEYPSNYLITLCSKCHRTIHGKEYKPHTKYTKQVSIQSHIKKMEII